MAALLVPAGCSRPRPRPAAAAPSAPTPASPVQSPTPPAPSPSPSPTATPEPNLLSFRSGTIVRRYPGGVADPRNAADRGFAPAGAAGPSVFVFELPGVAKLTRVSAQLPRMAGTGDDATVTFAASLTGPDSGFSEIAAISAAQSADPQAANVDANARWIRVTASSSNPSRPVNFMGAYGEIASPPPTMNVSGTYAEYDNPYDKSGTFHTAPGTGAGYLHAVALGGDVNGQRCSEAGLADSYPGTLSGRTWTWQNENRQGTFIANDDASVLVAADGLSYWVRTDTKPKFCAPQVVGKGPIEIAVLESRAWFGVYPFSDQNSANDAPRFRFAHIAAPFVDASALRTASAVVLDGLCDADELFTPGQDRLIADWVAQGHKLLIYDADMCNRPTHYAMLPYQFQSDNPGANGAKGDRLIQVEDDSLGSSDAADKEHYFDPAVYAKNPNQLGDANTVTTHDSHWCGHLFGTNVHHVNGFMQMYANYGKGVIIYDGFDRDDIYLPPYKRLRMLELAQPIPADLPCSQKASLAFLIQPDRDGRFTPGKAATLAFPMELLANQGWSGHVNLSAGGDFKASVTPSSLDVNGGTIALKIALSVPANTKPGTYAVLVNGDGGPGQSAQATITLTAAMPIVKQFQQKRIRLYGIHFDVDKATIKPQSEPVIAQIAAVMNQNPSWRFRVEGHTDSDGGYRHNMVLSQHRAQAVVDDLVARYHIARSRLRPQGYGYSKPVAPNTTDAGKALNRRVELFRLNGEGQR